MTINTFATGPLTTNTYVVSCPLTRECAIIDAAPHCLDAVIKCIETQQLKPTSLLLTHSHWDHIADAAPLKKKYSIPVYIHPEDVDNLKHPGADRLPCWLDIEGITPDALLEEGQEIRVGTLLFKVIHTPGHTPGGVCFYCADRNLLFSGDTLFQGTIGNVSFSTGRPRLMWDSLKKLAKLPPETQVFPGHGPSTTIGAEPWLSQAEDLFGN